MISDDAHNAPGVMRQLWMTPIYSTNIFRLNGNDQIKNQKFLMDLETTVLARYKKAAQVDDTNVHGLNKVDNLYLIDQKEELLYKQCVSQNTTSCQPPYSFRYALIQLFYQEVVKFLQECGLSNVEIPKSSLDIDLAFSIWASVHANGSYHLAHHHENSMVSGVLYAATPAGAGDFVANDPRGPLPPFGRSQHFTPQLGDMILFPGWLMHSVLPTLSSLPRVSISFNFIGRWDTTTDLNQGFFI